MKTLKEYLITESVNSQSNEWPNVKTLGNGEFEGALWGNCFIYDEQKYFCETGILSMFPSYFKVTINEDDVQLNPIDDQQRPELKELFK